MPQGDKSAYTDKQKRQAKHIEDGYLERGVSQDKAEEIAWSTVNKQDGGGNQSGSGRSSERSEAARKGWETRRRAQTSSGKSGSNRKSPSSRA
jgi:plasmid stabilization system protein ParE